MVQRTARQGPNAGNRFWGCPKYPACQGTRNISDAGNPGASGQPKAAFTKAEAKPARQQRAPLPVSWKAAERPELVPEYAPIGAMPGILPESLRQDERLRRAVGQCLVLSRSDRDRESEEHARRVSALLVKLLQRGRAPLATLGVEETALRRRGLLDDARDLSEGGTEMGWALRSGGRRCDARAILSALSRRDDFLLDSSVDFDSGIASSVYRLGSEDESSFLETWVPRALGPSAGHWFTPQASLECLIESLGVDAPRDDERVARRVDFLFCHPGGRQSVIELDGQQHRESVQVDRDRDAALEAAGLEVVRVPVDEARRGTGPGLQRIERLHDEAVAALAGDVDEFSEAVAAVMLDCANAARVQFAVARAVDYGWLQGSGEWEIRLVGAGEVEAVGVCDALAMLEALDVLYGGRSAPDRCRVLGETGELAAWSGSLAVDGRAPRHCGSKPQSLTIAVDRSASPFHEVAREADADFLIRPVCLPVALAAENTGKLPRSEIVPETSDDARPALQVFLHHVFRKVRFREKQDLAVFNALRQQDCVVLLPTGAGKSLVYQLAGLLMPGVTLVVDPIVALMEDQVDGLRRYGIDRAAEVSGGLSPEARDDLLSRFERGEYQFMLLTPERMQSPKFRKTLVAVRQASLINLAVIDEAHCVSEWGHDFRPAYLRLADNLRRFGRDASGRHPPILALTGTASRAVLRDMLEAVGIDKERSDALVRPDSFNRKELSFEILRVKPEHTEAGLRGVLGNLPSEWRLPKAQFFGNRGDDTSSGIVFVPNVNGKFGLDVDSAVRHATSAKVGTYSGSKPKGRGGDWETTKRQNARAFKSNDIPILVATKAFGMGIDKPNIRYTVHYGMPSSLENFYQEAGRAGRDQKPARCKVVFTEYDSARSDHLLDPNAGLEELRARYDAVLKEGWSSRDDVRNALFFHFVAFGNVENELSEVRNLVGALGDLSSARTVPVPFGRGGQKSREKALYRLVRLRVVRDYEVDYGGKSFTVYVRPFDLNESKSGLLSYVEATQPARAPILARRMDDIGGEAAQCVVELAAMLIEFTYDVVERSRRRMIQESMLLARRADGDEEIRRRLLDYLSEGLGAEQIEELLQQQEIDFTTWFELFESVRSPLEAGELRGLCIRSLESYPDHPALLLVRAVAEAMCSDHDGAVSSGGIADALRAGAEKYEMSRIALEGAIDRIFELAASGVAPELSHAATRALLGFWGDPSLTWAAERGRERAERFAEPASMRELATWRVELLTEEMERVVGGTMNRWAGLKTD